MINIINFLYADTGSDLINKGVDVIAKSIDKPLTTSSHIAIMVGFLLIILAGAIIFYKIFKKSSPTINLTKLFNKLEDIKTGLKTMDMLKDRSSEIIILKSKMDEINNIVSKNREELIEIRLNDTHNKNDMIRLENNYRDIHLQLVEVNSILKKLFDDLMS